MEIHKDKQFKVLFDLLIQNLAYTRCLAEIVLLKNSGPNMDLLNASIAELNQEVQAKTIDMRNRLLEEYGDIDDFLNP